MKRYLVVFLLLVNFNLFAQDDDKWDTQRLPDGIQRSTHQHYFPDGGSVEKVNICPPNWWVGMKNPALEIMIHDENIADLIPKISFNGVSIKSSNRLASPNYLFIQVEISPRAKAGKFEIQLQQNDKTIKTYNYELQDKGTSRERIQNLNSSDFIYLIMPDRFANGDPKNDLFVDMEQKEIDRSKMYFRHGGDLQGIIDHLDYLQELGVTALWLNPAMENNQPYESYHGYAITDHYKIDKRFGDNALFKKLTDECQKRGIKMVMDIIHNHVGDKHWFIQDIPSEDWLNQWDEFTRTTYRAPTHMDPHVSDFDHKRMTDGWFDHHMPDLNQRNPHLAKYLIQNNIWWIEYAGLDGYRVDTYAYPDQAFMAEWGKAMQAEYPQVHLFAETWVHGGAVQAHFTEDNDLTQGYNSNMPGVTDFQLYYAINEALDRDQGWTEGVARIYYTLAKDFLYEDPMRNVVFLDNHDLSRFYSMVKENDDKFKSGIAFLLTTRGIPMMYYGTEILMKNYSDPDGKVREDFPGGWEDDKVNKFVKEGRTKQEEGMHAYVKKLANFRKKSKALKEGTLKQFVPEGGVYVYFRSFGEEKIMVIMNTSNKPKSIIMNRFAEELEGKKGFKDVISEKTFPIDETLLLFKNQTLILQVN